MNQMQLNIEIMKFPKSKLNNSNKKASKNISYNINDSRHNIYGIPSLQNHNIQT